MLTYITTNHLEFMNFHLHAYLHSFFFTVGNYLATKNQIIPIWWVLCQIFCWFPMPHLWLWYMESWITHIDWILSTRSRLISRYLDLDFSFWQVKIVYILITYFIEQNVISIKIDLPENKDGFYGYFNMGKYCVSTAENKKIWQTWLKTSV